MKNNLKIKLISLLLLALFCMQANAQDQYKHETA